MDKLIKFIDLYWPVEYCNLSCKYCYIHQHRQDNKKRFVCSHSAHEIRKALSKKRLGGCCLLNICAGGETLVEDNIVPIVRELLEEGHYINIVTNGTIQRTLKMIMDFPENLRKRLLLKFSFHYDELKSRSLLEDYTLMVKKIREKGISVSIELPAYDAFLQEEHEIMEFCRNKFEVLPHVATLRDEAKAGFSLLSKYTFSELKARWGSWKSPLFEIRSEIMEKKYKGFCYAGEWTATINLESGQIKQCHYESVIDNLYENIDRPISWRVVGNRCHSEYCYACHVFLTLGNIPELNLKYKYSDTRDRNGIWLEPEMKEFMSQRLWENNEQYGWLAKRKINKKNQEIERNAYQAPEQFAQSLIISMKNEKEKNNYVLLEARHQVSLLYHRLPRELKWINHIYSGDKIRRGECMRIRALGKAAPEAEGNEIGIVGVIADDIWYDAVDLFDPVWIVKNRMFIWNEYSGIDSKSITGYMPTAKRIILILEKNKWRGLCEVDFKGQKRECNCYEDIDDAILDLCF